MFKSEAVQREEHEVHNKKTEKENSI